MLNKKHVLNILLSLIFFQSSLFGMVKDDVSDFFILPEDIHKEILKHCCTTPSLVKNILLLSKYYHDLILKNMCNKGDILYSLFRVLKKEIRRSVYLKRNKNLLENNPSEILKNYQKKVRFFKKIRYLGSYITGVEAFLIYKACTKIKACAEIKAYIEIKEEHDLVFNGTICFNGKNFDILIARINEKSENSEQSVSTFINHFRKFVNNNTNNKNILVINTDHNDIRQRILSEIPNSFLEKTIALYCTRDETCYRKERNVPLQNPIVPEETIQLCPNLKILGLIDMEITKERAIDIIKSCKKLRFADFRHNHNNRENRIYDNTVTTASKALEFLDIRSEFYKRSRNEPINSIATSNDCIVRSGFERL